MQARIAAVLESLLSADGIAALVEPRDADILVVTAGKPGAARRLAAMLRSGLPRRRDELPVAVEVGLGLDAADIAGVPQACEEAERAVEFTEPRRPVVVFGDIDLVELLLRRPDRVALRLIPEWADRLREADRRKAGDLVRTVRAFTESDLNVKRTARHLKLHTNTVYFRLNRIKKLTGVDPRSFSGASLLLTAMRMLEAKATGSRVHAERASSAR